MAFNFQGWKKGAIGRRIDVDHAYGDQCKDVIMDYAQALFKKPYPKTIGYGNAKDVFKAASPTYFQKIVNNPHDAKQIPRQGDIIVYGPFTNNPYGHIAVVDSANTKGVNVIEQNGFKRTGKTYEKFRSYSALPVIGWLRPKTSFVSKVAQKVRPKPPAVIPKYIVHRGDTLTAIARHYKTTVSRLAKLNNIKNVNQIKTGQVLRLR